MSSMHSLVSLALGATQFLLGDAPGGGPISCPNPQLSCHNSTDVENTCCFLAPGGQLLQTQFWDTNPATGPSDHWTVHGLWPDHCDGTFDANCDSGRAYTNITQILEAYNQTNLLTYMETYWKDYQGDDETFWEHEWAKHGTCISTLSPSCYADYTPQEEIPDFFNTTVNLFTTLDTYKFLSAAGITPSTTRSYTSSSIQAALAAARGVPATIGCTSAGDLNQVFYHFNVKGPVQSGQFVAAAPDGSKSTCPRSVKYLPKDMSTVPTGVSKPDSTARKTAVGAGPTATATGTPFLTKGGLNVVVAESGREEGCIISGGAWYTTGTCARFTAKAVGGGAGFTLESRKGLCAIARGALTCGASVEVGTVFGKDGELLTYEGSRSFYAESTPAGNQQGTVSTAEGPVEINISW